MNFGVCPKCGKVTTVMFSPPKKIRTPDGKIVEVIGFKCQNKKCLSLFKIEI